MVELCTYCSLRGGMVGSWILFLPVVAALCYCAGSSAWRREQPLAAALTPEVGSYVLTRWLLIVVLLCRIFSLLFAFSSLWGGICDGGGHGGSPGAMDRYMAYGSHFWAV